MAEGNDSEFVRCPNGHKYMQKLGQCPYCPKPGHATTSKPTDVYGSSATSGGKTETYERPTEDYDTKQNNPSVGNPVPPRGGNAGQPFDPNKTGFGGDYDPGTGHSDDLNAETPQIRYTRRLVGVLYTRDIDNMGVVFNIFEGRNFIGRNGSNCSIKVFTDALMSSKHALLLVRGDSFILRDEMSAHGTFVNDEDIATEPYTLKDGDVLRMGSTKFLFRSFN